MENEKKRDFSLWVSSEGYRASSLFQSTHFESPEQAA